MDRLVLVTWESFGPHWPGLSSVADRITMGAHRREQRDGENDDEFLERVSREFDEEFQDAAAAATGAGGFSFIARFKAVSE